MCLGCAPARGVVPAPPPAVFTPTPAEPAARAQITALAPELDAFLRERFGTSAATGMVAGVVLQGELVYEHSFGVLARGSSAAVSGESVFRVGSLSKSFSALALLQLRDAGKLSLDVLAAVDRTASP